MNFTKLFHEFTESSKAGGFLLLLVSVVSLAIANSVFGEAYHHFWATEFLGGTLEYWVNDGLMTIFFLLVGLEIEREIYIGELSDFKKAALPVVGAIGGMVVPVVIYVMVNLHSENKSGLGIPMATDIAFALGILSLLGDRIPVFFKIFLTALAIIDDLGAVILIAIFYSNGFSLFYFGLAIGVFVLLCIMNRLKIYNVWLYIIPGVIMWYCMLNSGVHATITGVLLAFAIPFGSGDERSTSYRLQQKLHKPVAFLLLPIFALANTGVVINASSIQYMLAANGLGIISGLIIGKPLGIVGAVYIAIKSRICRIPEGIRIRQFWGVGFLGGIGFTMSIFISLLAFNDKVFVDSSKLAILIASFIAGLTGFLILKKTRFENS